MSFHRFEGLLSSFDYDLILANELWQLQTLKLNKSVETKMNEIANRLHLGGKTLMNKRNSNIKLALPRRGNLAFFSGTRTHSAMRRDPCFKLLRSFFMRENTSRRNFSH